ncbi:5-aminolevulinate synthase, erythroid-specific, mitochondrial-like, partial [Parus major]|uniref:5-aminolevulinate synthase, erythroid-specific, mitochondrial-like n=1 Tax=Parus major TaxID=9157 RepID=UPI000771206F
ALSPPGDPPEGSHCPFIALEGEEPPFVQRAAPELQEDVTPPEPEPLDWLLDLGDALEDPPERRLEENLPEDAFPYEAVFGGRLAGLRRSHTYREFTAVGRRAQHPPTAFVGSPPRLIQLWCSNDYLGMSRHPEVLRAARAALAAHGLGAGGTRNIAGTAPLHGALERALARLHRQPRACLFSSCFAANDTALATLARLLPGCHIFSDAGNHASMVQGILRSGAPKHIFRHNDPQHLDELLGRSPPGVPKIVAFESVHSMDGQCRAPQNPPGHPKSPGVPPGSPPDPSPFLPKFPQILPDSAQIPLNPLVPPKPSRNPPLWPRFPPSSPQFSPKFLQMLRIPPKSSPYPLSPPLIPPKSPQICPISSQMPKY